MRVLFAITKGEVGGAQEHVRLLAVGLLGAGHEVGIAVRDPSELATALRDRGAAVLPWQSIEGGLDPLADRAARAELARIVADWSPDILHLNSSKAGTVGVGLLRPPAGVTIFTCHHPPFGPHRKFLHRVVAYPTLRMVFPRFDGMISVGERDEPVLRRMAPRVPFRVIPNGVAPPPVPDSSGPLKPVALWVARMAHPKDPLLLVKAWPAVVTRHPEARLLMCGGGPLAARVRAAVDASPARNRITYAGFVDDLSDLRRQASVFALSTRVEGGLTMATLESMANGLVPVVSDAGDAPMLVQRDMGECVRGRSAGAFADAVADLFADPDRYAELRANAVHYATSERTTTQTVADTVDFYRSVLGRASVTGKDRP